MKITLLASITADGFIAQATSQSSLNWTSKEDTRFFIQKTKEIGTIIMGSTTFATIKPKHLPFVGRKIIVLSRSELHLPYDQAEVRVESGAISDVLAKLEAEGIKHAVLAGGASVYTQFMQAGLVDELFLTVEPIVFGAGIKLFSEAIQVKLHLEQVIDLPDQTKVFHYLVVKE